MRSIVNDPVEDEDEDENNHPHEDEDEDENDHPHGSGTKMMEDLQHFCHEEHPLVFNQNDRRGVRCYGCREPVYGPSYWCEECYGYVHHKSCAELPLGLHHPLHPKHPLILFSPERYKNKEFPYENVKCEVCKEVDRYQYSYGCSRCNFNIHIKCASIPPTMESEVHNHPLTPFWKWITFTCDLCGKESTGIPNPCASCSFWTDKSCASCLRRVKVTRHEHPLDLIHSLEVHQSDSRFCQICAQKVDTDYGLYYCSECDFIAHLNCAMDWGNMEELIDEESTESKTMLENQSVDSATYEVKEFSVGKDGTEIATKVKHFSHEHDLKLFDEVPINKICDGCVRAILTPFYSCGECSFFLHKSCVELPRKKRHPLHHHPLTLLPNLRYEWSECYACERGYNRFTYSCDTCGFNLDIQCSLISDILIHHGHEHPLMLSSIMSRNKCNCCGYNVYPIFRCTTCEFALDFRCATLPHTTRYKQHEHPFALCSTAEDDSGEYYCDICEEERDPKHWFYYCADCSYPAHPKCILEENPN
uniref:Phorbol-ester/DAG-type domain-containing protein n=1 Tax=Fagus sylvatica TaxID=28930 RepID=A0A2N9EUY7_FAGSY